MHLPAHCKELLMTGGQTVSCVHAQALQSMVALVMEAEIQRSGGILTVTCL